MKKGKEWLKEEIKKLITEESQYMPHGEMVDLGLVLLTIDQLDEPEKPVIPQFVADYIELNKCWSEDRQEYIEDDNSGLRFALDGNSYGMPNSVSDWLFNEEKVETFAKAWLDGYEVEKEKLYRVVFSYKGETVYLKESAHGDFDVIETETYGTQYTEAEIKAIDERFWAFAEEVTP